MACEYSFDGGKTFISKEEFIKKLAEGKLDEFISQGLVDLGKVRGIGQKQTLTEEQEVNQVAEKVGISPKNLKDLYDINRKLFGLDRLKSLAAAITMDRMIGVMAKRAGVSKSEMYSKLNFQKASEENIPQGTLLQVDAFHGSPYEFDKFTTQKIGTGEGAQAFGWGLYFTDLESIAKGYAEKLAKAKYDAKSFGEENIGIANRAILNIESTGSVDNAIKFLKDLIEKNKNGDTSKTKEILDFIEKNKDKFTVSKTLYKVSLHEGKTPEQYNWLVWDKTVGEKIASKIPISIRRKIFDFNEEKLNEAIDKASKPYKVKNKQLVSVENIKDFYEKLGFEGEKLDRLVANRIKSGATYFAFVLEESLVSPSEFFQDKEDAQKYLDSYKIERNEYLFPPNSIKSSLDIRNEIKKDFDVFDYNITGEELYKRVIERLTDSDYDRSLEWLSTKGMPSSRIASLFLLENGIDGIKYPAESVARGATSDNARGFNYVVFDENAVSIKEVIKFQKDAEKARGAVMVSMDGQATIYALTDPNVSTPVHELAHVFEHYLTNEERQEVIKNAGTKEWDIKTSEYFARGFEKYLANGNAPTEGLKKVFQKFKQWLTDIYNGIKDSDIDIELNPKMEEIYAKMLGEDAVKKKKTPPPPPPKQDSLADKARNKAAKLRSGEENVLPDWLRADLPKETKKQGASINEAYAAALETFADVYEKAQDFKKAVDEAFKKLSDWYNENDIDFDEKDLKAKFEAEMQGKKQTADKSISEREKAEGREVALAHADTEQKRAELGLDGRTLREVKKDEQLEAEANEAIKNGYNVKGLMKRILGGDLPTDTEHIILVKYAAGLESKLEGLTPSSKEFADVFNEINEVYKASEKGGSELGAAFRARQKRAFKQDSLGEMLVREAEVNMVDELTPAQREEVVKEYEAIKKAKEEWESKYNELVEQQNQKDAEEEVAKVKKSTTPKKKDFTKERQSIKESIKEKWNKAANDGTLMAIPVPYAKQLAAISPDVAKLMRSYVEEGVTELADIVKAIHGDIKEYVDGVTEKDVRDIIGGVYNEKRTRTELAIAVNDLRQEQKLLFKLEALQNGETPTTENKKREQNKKLKELRDKIKSLKQDDIDAAKEVINAQKQADKEAKRLEKEANKKSPEQIALDNVKKRVTKQIQELEEKLAKGDYSKDEPKKPIKLDKEALELKDKLIKLKQEREIRILQEKYKNRTFKEKTKDTALEVINVPRTVMASMDFSAPLRQGAIASIANPKIASKAFIEMFRQAASQQRFDRWFFDLRETPEYDIMEKSGLYIADPHDPKLSAKEEMFMNNLAEKIPFIGGAMTIPKAIPFIGGKKIGGLIKGSERAYVSYLNKMRVDLFNLGIKSFMAEGKTVENSPELYKSLASFINNSTGRGQMTKLLEDSAPILNSLFFSPRLMASRINLLNPMYYKNLSPEVQKMALKDMGTFILFGMSILGLAAMAGADVEEDPRSPNYGKIKIGDTTYDIWGGFQQYIVQIAQLVRGETKSATTGEIRKLDGKTFPFKSRGDDVEAFVRGKLAPVPAATLNMLYGKKVTGQNSDYETEFGGLMQPLMVKDAVEAYGKNGLLGAFAVGIPASLGIGVQTISGLPEGANETKDVWKFIKAKKARVPEVNTESMLVGDKQEPMTEEEREEFLKLRLSKIEKGLDILIKNGYEVVEGNKRIQKEAVKLTPEQLKPIITKIARHATEKANEEVFGKRTKNKEEEKQKKKAEEKNKKLIELMDKN